MTRKKKWTIVAAAGTAVVALGLAGWHKLRGCHDAKALQGHLTHKVDRVLDRVDADETQRSKILAMTDRVFDEVVTAHSSSTVTTQELLEQWNSDAPDAERLHELIDQRVAAYRKAAHEIVDGMLEAHATLNAEQRAQIGQIVAKRMRH